MTKRRSRGDGGLHWDSKRQRWIASVTVGYTPAGKRIVRRASGRTKTEAKDKLKELLRDHDDGLTVKADGYTVAQAVTAWLTYGLHGRGASTVANYRVLCETHITPALGARKLRELSADDVDRWLTGKAKTLSTRTLRLIHSCLNRIVKFAQARDRVKRNVVALCEVPDGKAGRPSKAFTLEQAEAVLNTAEDAPIHAYIVLSMLIGARTEELRALRWSEVDLVGRPNADIPPSVAVWRSVRADGDTKTKKSRRTLALPQRCVQALSEHWRQQVSQRAKAGARWADNDLVFASAVGTELDAHNVRRAFRQVVTLAGLNGAEWTPREMRHSFVSLLSSDGVPLEVIARLVGHSGTAVTETVYRKQIRPVLLGGAEAMDRIFREHGPTSPVSSVMEHSV
jgi:integrase